MPRLTGKLTGLTVSKAKEKGLYGDGDGLYLQVGDSASNKSWVLRYMIDGKARKMGLGSYPTFLLADAREIASEKRKLIGQGIDPIKARDEEHTKQKLAIARQQTFKQCAAAYIDSNRAAWRNPKSGTQWEASLESYVYPMIGDLPVQDVDVALVMKVLEQKSKKFKDKTFWAALPETANRVRTRIESVLDWATARGFRIGDNPARWRGHLENLLPKKSKLKGVKHHNALPYSEVAGFIFKLRQYKSVGAAAFELLILTAARTGEILNARWSEFDLEKKVWIIPDRRTKAGREHRVPLCDRAIQILKNFLQLKDQKNFNINDFVFPGQHGPKKPLSKMGLLYLLKDMGLRKTITVHGFRSTFRDWCAEQTSFSRETAESALAHIGGDKVELAYKRTDLFDKRRRLMDSWAKYCETPSQEGKVIVGAFNKSVARK